MDTIKLYLWPHPLSFHTAVVGGWEEDYQFCVDAECLSKDSSDNTRLTFTFQEKKNMELYVIVNYSQTSVELLLKVTLGDFSVDISVSI